MSLLDTPRMARAGPADIVLGPGSSVPLDAEAGVLRVERGRIELYAVLDEVRCFLAELAAGSVLIGAGDGRLSAVAPDGAMLSPQRWRTPFEEAEATDAWVRLLCDGLARYAPTRPELRSVMIGEEIELAAGEALAAGRGIVWLHGETLAGSTFGLVPAPPGPHPVSPGVWTVSATGGSIVGRSTLDLVQSGEAAASLAAFQSCAAEVLRRRTEQDRHAEIDRVEGRERAVGQKLDDARERLVGVLSARLPRPPEAEDDIGFVLDRVTGERRAAGSRAAPINDFRQALDARGLRSRTVTLAGPWWRQDRGNLVGFLRDGGTPVALVTNWRGRYRLLRRGSPPLKLGRAVAAGLQPQAMAIARPLPNRPLTLRDLAAIGALLCRTEIATILVAALGASLLGLLLPLAIGQVIDTFIPDRLHDGVVLLGAALVMLNLCSALIQFGADMARLRIDAKLSSALQVGVIDRVLRLPSSFLRAQTSADLTFRVMALDQVRRLLTNTVLSPVLGGIFGLTSFGLLFYYSAPAALAALGIFAAFILVATWFGLAQIRALAAGDALTVNLTSLTLQVIQNVSMLRAFGAERRAFALWAQNTAAMRSRMLRARLASIGFETFLACYDGLALAAVFFILGYAARGSHLSTGAYLAFVATFQGFLVSNEGLGRAIVQLAGARPMLQRAGVLLRETPESSDAARHPGELRGEIEVSSVSFRYDDDAPLVLNGVSIRAEPGRFIAIAGPSGCGKSTLMSLILGFSSPTDGAVLYDGHDLASLNKAAVRRQIGVVRQGGKLIGGSIFENILGMHEGTIDDAWAAADAAGIGDDIRAMPMGLHTVLNEGVPTFSGGQVQRLLIARALVGKPKILLLDEATSALDNVTQAAVTAAIDRLGVTRIVIAHRLSTIRNADAIHFFDRGRVAESGTYDELMRRNGLFAAFASRQSL